MQSNTSNPVERLARAYLDCVAHGGRTAEKATAIIADLTARLRRNKEDEAAVRRVQRKLAAMRAASTAKKSVSS